MIMSLNNAELQDAAAFIPDLRASICHTSMAAGFLLINLQNPYRVPLHETKVELLVMMSLPVIVFLSWSMFVRRFRNWQRLTTEQQQRITRTPKSLLNRAVTHLLMALLATGLTLLGYVGHVVGAALHEPGPYETTLLVADVLVAIVAITAAFRAITDIWAFWRFTRKRA